MSSHRHLQDVEADAGPDWAVVRMRLLVRVHVERADGAVGVQAALLAEDEQGARPADLQVVRQQEGDGLADQGAGHAVALQVAQLQRPGTQLHADVDAVVPQLFENTHEYN